MSADRSDQPSYRADIDGLRAVAVTSVLVFHAFPGALPGGFVGVDVFFVISGFLISSILLKSFALGRFSLADFYSRRIRRIFPALTLVLSSCLVFGWFGLFADELASLGKHMAGGAGFVSNLLSWGETGYFDAKAEIKPLIHLWSLGIEEQFYIFWPLLLYLAFKLRVQAFGVIAVLSCASFAWNSYSTIHDASAAFYLPFSRVWELFIGAGLAAGPLEHYRLGIRRFEDALSCVGALLLASAFYAIRSGPGFPGFWALLPTIGAALIIAAGPNAVVNRKVLSARPMVWVGLISYPLYLWHWPLLSFARIVQSGVPPAWMRAVLLALALVLAVGTYFAVERPLRRGGRARLKVLALSGAMAMIGGTGYAVLRADGWPERPIAQRNAAYLGQFEQGWLYSLNSNCARRYHFREARKLPWWFCIANRNAPPTMILLGDSYANHLYPGLGSHARLKNQIVLSIGTCGVELGRPSDPLTPRTANPCTGDRALKQRQFIEHLVETSPSLRYAIIDGLEAKSDSDYAERIEERIAFLVSRNIQVVLFVPHVRADMDPRRCFPRPFRPSAGECAISSQVRRAVDAGFQPLARRLQDRFPTLKVFDQNAVYCHADQCTLVVDGRAMFRDSGGHYSVYASGLVADAFVAWAERELPEILN